MRSFAAGLRDRFQMAHDVGEIFKVAPEGIERLARFADHDAFFHLDRFRLSCEPVLNFAAEFLRPPLGPPFGPLGQVLDSLVEVFGAFGGADVHGAV